MKRRLFSILCLCALALTGCGAGTAEAAGDSDDPSPVFWERPSYDIYAPFGLTYDQDTDTLTFGGQTVRYFLDGVEIDGGTWAILCEHISEAGTVDVHTVREVLQNDGGDQDRLGPLTGIEAYSQEAFDRRDMDALLRPSSNAVTEVSGDDTLLSGETFADRFAAYRDFGIEYVESQSACGTGNVYFQGRLVNAFIDISEQGTFTFHSADSGAINVRTVYDRYGNLLRVEQLSV